MSIKLGSVLLTGACAALLTSLVHAENFNIPRGDLDSALEAYMTQSGVTLVMSNEAVKGVKSPGVKGQLSSTDALVRILSGTGFVPSRNSSGVVEIVRGARSSDASGEPATHIAAASAPAVSGAALETVTVTSSKIGGDVQNIPIAITALSQEQLTARQIAGGPDLVKEVPNLTFSKTNFTGYNIQIRGIGTQAISVTTDPAVAVAFNDIPFIRNHFFEQEFYDLSQAEVLRGPQGTLYGRNATAGVVNIVSAKPTDQFEAMASVDIGNYQNRRLEGMVNLPVVDDRLDIRVAGEWTKRNGYSFNDITDQSIDGRNLWSGRVTIGLKPFANLQTYFVWEHFQESDDRLRSAKQLCKTDNGPGQVDGVPVPSVGQILKFGISYLSQGCSPASFYSPESFEVPNGYSLPYWSGPDFAGVMSGANPYASATQSRNLRDIQSTIDPTYQARNDTIEFNADYTVTPSLTFSSQTGFNNDFLRSTEDFNRFNTEPGVFNPNIDPTTVGDTTTQMTDANGVFCDPQLGCSDRLVAEDLSVEHSWQLSQEFRLASNFSGPLNFSVGANYLHYETDEKYYVFVNSLTAYAYASSNNPGSAFVKPLWIPGVTDEHDCIEANGGFKYRDPRLGGGDPALNVCIYIDPNPISNLNDNGHNYFLSDNPYTLNSYAGFGEAYYNATSDLKLIGGLRWTDDQKHFLQIPSWLVGDGWGYPVAGVVHQSWGELTGRFAANWTPKLNFTDQTLIYGSYAHGYKAGGANPPGAELLVFASGDDPNPVHPLTFKPEFINAFELGTKNTLLDGALTLNGDVFFYDYKQYQISEIVDRSAINLNFDATVKGAELETTWEPAPGLKFTFAGGYEDARLANGSQAIDLMDRTGGHADWMVVKPFATQASNCILPVYVVAALLEKGGGPNDASDSNPVNSCGNAYGTHFDPVTVLPYVPNPTENSAGSFYTIPAGYVGFDPVNPNATNNGAGPAPNNGEGFEKNLGGNELPNAPHFTTALSAEYTLPLSQDWASTLHGDFYWQSQSFARVFNDRPYDELHGYSNLNLALIFTSASGWQAIGYLKNVFNTTAITGAFLNSDDSGLTTNVFLTDPRLFGVRVTKNF